MKANRNEINEKAKEAYQKIFHEEPQKKNLDKEQDVVLNINDLENEVEQIKEKEEKRISSLHLLRKQIDEKAKKRLNQHFVENHKDPLEHQSMDTETMYQQMKEQECQLLEEVAMMKEKQLNSK